MVRVQLNGCERDRQAAKNLSEQSATCQRPVSELVAAQRKTAEGFSSADKVALRGSLRDQDQIDEAV